MQSLQEVDTALVSSRVIPPARATTKPCTISASTQTAAGGVASLDEQEDEREEYEQYSQREQYQVDEQYTQVGKIRGEGGG